MTKWWRRLRCFVVTTTPVPHVRPVTVADKRFLFAVYASTRTEELATTNWTPTGRQAFLQSQFETRQEGYRAHFPKAKHQIICTGRTAIGVCSTQLEADALRLLDLALLPDYRGAGIGHQIVRGLQDEARLDQKPMRLHALSFSRAVRFFTRLDFAPAGSHGPYIKMEWRPPMV